MKKLEALVANNKKLKGMKNNLPKKNNSENRIIRAVGRGIHNISSDFKDAQM